MGLGDPGWSYSLQRPGKSSSVNRGACWRGRKQKGSSCSLRSRGGLCSRGSRALTSDPGSSPRSPGAARPLFTQDPSRGPRSCRARVLLNPPFPDFHPLPPTYPLSPAASPGGGFSGWEPPPHPHPESPGRWAAVRPLGAGSAERASPAGPGLRGRGGKGKMGRRPEGRGARRPGPAALLRPGPVDCYWSACPAPCPCPPQPRSFRGNVGRKQGWLFSPPPSNFVFSWGMRKQSNLIRCPILSHKVPSCAGPPPSQPPLFKTSSLSLAGYSARSPRALDAPAGPPRPPPAWPGYVPSELCCFSSLEAPSSTFHFFSVPGGVR